jgi:ribosomal protein S11
MTEPPHEDHRDPAGEAQAGPDIGRSLGAVVGAVLDVGVSLSRVLAQATAVNGTVEPLPPATPPLQAIVRYGVTAMGNVVSAIATGGQVLRKAAGATAAAAEAAAQVVASPLATVGAAAAAGARGGPRVHAGATLRVPLSVENTGERPMQGLEPRVRALGHAGRDGADASGVIPVGGVRFAPERFDVAPRDFEKLTVFIAVPDDTPAGKYELVLALGAEEPDLKIGFDVAESAA